jgi:hypothetical protein
MPNTPFDRSPTPHLTDAQHSIWQMPNTPIDRSPIPHLTEAQHPIWQKPNTPFDRSPTPHLTVAQNPIWQKPNTPFDRCPTIHLIPNFFLTVLFTFTSPKSSSEAKKSNHKDYTHLPNFSLTLKLATVKFKVSLISLAEFPTPQRTLSLPPVLLKAVA